MRPILKFDAIFKYRKHSISNAMERIRDENRREIGRKKRKSDSGEQMRVRNEKRTLQEVLPVVGTLQFNVQTKAQKHTF